MLEQFMDQGTLFVLSEQLSQNSALITNMGDQVIFAADVQRSLQFQLDTDSISPLKDRSGLEREIAALQNDIVRFLAKRRQATLRHRELIKWFAFFKRRSDR